MSVKENKKIPRFLKKYRNEIIGEMMKKFNWTNVMSVPCVKKIVINRGVGEAINDRKELDRAALELGLISGQKPLITKAKKSIANFKLREGVAIGCKVTLRGNRMYEFFDRLVSIALPRVRDFQGISPRSFDRRGNYNFGIQEQIIFPEIDFDKVDKIRGMDICIVTTAGKDEIARELLKLFGVPFRKN